MPLGFVVDVHRVPVRVGERVRRAKARPAVVPSDAVPARLDRRDAALQRGLAGGAQPHLADARRRGRREFDGVVLVVIPGVQERGVAVTGYLLHGEELGEEPQAFLEFGGQQFDVAQMGHVMKGVVHWLSFVRSGRGVRRTTPLFE
jgi:hypothetical protein